jgi:murein DD-endopeptidase MepM/ murein hydrolase activator NlpD
MKLEEQISQTSALIKSTEKDKKLALISLRTFNEQIKIRKELIITMNHEVRLLNQDISQLSLSRDSLQASLDALTIKYNKLLRFSYINKLSQHAPSFLLSANNLNEAFSRWSYLARFQRYHKSYQNQLHLKRNSLQMEIGRLEESKSAKEALLESESSQKSQLEFELTKQEKLVSSLKNEESSLRSKLEKQRKENKDLAIAIENIIKAEIASKRTADVPDAPEVASLSKTFQSNKGRLPWPVNKGIITGHFGKQPHPVIKSLTISNNGVDFTSPENTEVLAIMEGIVVGKKFIPGFQNMVIIQHGGYYTVYSRLSEIYVEKGQKVSTLEKIGKLIEAESAQTAQLHFEIWEGKIQLDPEAWLNR